MNRVAGDITKGGIVASEDGDQRLGRLESYSLARWWLSSYVTEMYKVMKEIV